MSAAMLNLQANTISEMIHQVIANLVCMFDVKNNHLDEDDPWSDILEATAFVVRSKYYTMLQSTTRKMVFGCDMILNTPFIFLWKDIRRHKKQLIEKNVKTKS